MDTFLLHLQAAPSDSLRIHKCEDPRGTTAEGYLGFKSIHGNCFSLGTRWPSVTEVTLSAPSSFSGSLTLSVFSSLDIYWRVSKSAALPTSNLIHWLHVELRKQLSVFLVLCCIAYISFHLLTLISSCQLENWLALFHGGQLVGDSSLWNCREAFILF